MARSEAERVVSAPTIRVDWSLDAITLHVEASGPCGITRIELPIEPADADRIAVAIERALAERVAYFAGLEADKEAAYFESRHGVQL